MMSECSGRVFTQFDFEAKPYFPPLGKSSRCEQNKQLCLGKVWNSVAETFQAQVLTSHHLRLEEIYFRKTFPFSTEIWVYKCCASLFLFVWPSSLKRNITKNVLNGFERDFWMSYSGLYINVYIYICTGLHNLCHPTIRDGSTWSKFGAHGEHGDVFLFSNLGALWL